MKNLYLVGFMGTGKSTTGKLLAQKLNCTFVEMDEAIETQAGKTIVEIFAQDGEPRFRQLEKDLLKDLAQKENLVISCGGGLICNDENAALLTESGTVVTLTASPETIYNRTQIHTHRPLLNVADPIAKIRELMGQRNNYYAKAHITMNTDEASPEEVTEMIVKEITNV